MGRAALQAYVDAARPPLADEEEIDTIISGLAVALPRAKGDGAVAEAKLDIYASALADIPLVDLRAGADHLINTARFFPTVSEIRAAAARTRGKRTARIARAEMMMLRHDREWVPPYDAEHSAQVEATVSDALASHPSKR